MPSVTHRGAPFLQNQTTDTLMETNLVELGNGFDEPNAFTQLLTALITPPEESIPLNDALSFPEDLGAQSRYPGIEIYVDYVMGVFAHKASELTDQVQLRMLRLSCLDFAMTCLATFNEDLIIFGNEANVSVDAAIQTKDLATYVRLHPFARVMEWMFDDKVVRALISTIDQDAATLGSAAPDSPTVLSILRAIEVMLQVLKLQDTYLDLVRPNINQQSGDRRKKRANPV